MPGCLGWLCELAAVLPFGVDAYRESRPQDFRPEYDRQLALCSYVMAVDGIYDKPAPDTELARMRRGKGYRAQAEVLLRHADLMFIATDPAADFKPGSSIETLHKALRLGLPVLLFNTQNHGLYLLEPDQDSASVLQAAPLPLLMIKTRLQELSRQAIAEPDEGEHHKGTAVLLRDFFADAATLPLKARFRGRLWSWFDGRFKVPSSPIVSATQAIDVGADTPVAEKEEKPTAPDPFQLYRARASQLCAHFSGLYRGTFLLNFVLAVVAVAIAVASLAVLALVKEPSTSVYAVLLAAVVAKAIILGIILRNTQQANGQHWNTRAVGYRYLSECLRSMLYLPKVGCLQPPRPSLTRFSARVVHQSSLDWLFNAVIRSAQPTYLRTDKSSPTYAQAVDINPPAAIRTLRTDWVRGQATYHAATAARMRNLTRFLEKWTRRASLLVIVIVTLDALVVLAELRHWLECLHDGISASGVVLVSLSALLPAIVASLNGIRFQSECERLHERSEVFRELLEGGPRHKHGSLQRLAALCTRMQEPEDNAGAWTLDAMLEAERIASMLIQETAEWSVLYAKEVSEAG